MTIEEKINMHRIDSEYEITWKTAPKCGCMFIGDFGYPYAVVAAWKKNAETY